MIATIDTKTKINPSFELLFHTFSPDLQPFVQCIGCLRGKYGDYVAAANATVGCKSCVPGRYSAAESLTATVGKIPCIVCPKENKDKYYVIY